MASNDPLAFLDEEEQGGSSVASPTAPSSSSDDPLSFLDRASDFGRGFSGGLVQSAAGLVGLPGFAIPGDDFFEQKAQELRGFGQELGESSRAGELTGRLVGEGAQLVGGGTAIGKAVLPRIARAAAGRSPGVARTAARITRGAVAPDRASRAGRLPSLAERGQRLASESLIFSPVDAAIGLQRAQEEDSDPVQAIASEIALGAAGGAAFETVAAAARPIAKRVVNVQRTLDQARQLGRTLNEDEIDRVFREPFHPAAAVLRALRGESPTSAVSMPKLRPAADLVVDPENPIQTIAGGPLTENDEVVLFTRSLPGEPPEWSALPQDAPGDGNLVGKVFRAPIASGNLLRDSRRFGRLESHDPDAFPLPDPDSDDFLPALENAAEQRGLSYVPRGPRVRLGPDEFEVERGFEGLPHLKHGATSEVHFDDLSDEAKFELLTDRGKETVRNGKSLGFAARQHGVDDEGFREFALPTKDELAAQQDTIYHVTSRADLVGQSGMLIAQGRGISRGALSGALEPAVSFTIDKTEGEMLVREMIRAGRIARDELGDDPDELLETFREWAREDAEQAGLIDDQEVQQVVRAAEKAFRNIKPSIENSRNADERAFNLFIAFRRYLDERHNVKRRLFPGEGEIGEPGALVDPLLSTDVRSYEEISPHTVALVEMPVSALPDDAAIVRRWGDPLSEVAVYSDVDISKANFVGPRDVPHAHVSGWARARFNPADPGVEQNIEEIAERLGTRGTEGVLKELQQVAPETLQRMVASGELPDVDPNQFKGFTKSSPELLLSKEGTQVASDVEDQLKELMAAVADSDPRFATRPKSGRTIESVKEAALRKRSIEELATNERLTTPSLVAARNMLRGSIERLQTLHRAARNAVGSDRERIDLLISREHAAGRYLLKLVGSEISEAGLQLRLFREYAESQRQLDPNFWLEEARRLLGDTEFDRRKQTLTKEITKLIENEDRAGLARLMGKLEVPPLSQRLIMYWKAGLLTNPVTHAVNITSNLSFAGLERLVEEPAALVDYVLTKDEVASKLGLGDLPRTTVSPTKERKQRSVKRGAALGAELARSFVTGERPKSDLAERFFEAKTVLDNTKLDIQGREVPFKLFSDPGFIESIAEGQPREAVNAFAHHYVNGVFKALGSADMLFKGAALDASLVRQAGALAKQADESSEQILKRWLDSPRTIPDEVVLQAMLEASVRTFQDTTRLGQIFGLMQQLPGVGEFIVPFSRVMGALLTRTFEYSGFGVFSGVHSLRQAASELAEETPDRFAALRAKRRAVKQIARGFTGPGVLAAGYWLADQGLMIGNLPEFGTREREIADAAGLQERSLYVPAEVASSVGLPGGYYDISRIAPGGELVALGAMMHQELTDPHRTDWTRWLTPMLGATNLVMEQPFAQGLRRVARASDDPVSASRAFMLGLASSFVPIASAGVGAVARTIDPTVREDEGLAMMRFLTRIPWVSETRPPRLNALGEPIERVPGVVANLLLPGRVRAETDDPVLREMAKVRAGVPRLERRRFTRVDEEGNEVSEREPLDRYQRRQRVVGKMSYAAARAAVGSFTYQRVLPALARQTPLDLDELKREYIESEIDRVRSMLFREGLGGPTDTGREAAAQTVIQAIR